MRLVAAILVALASDARAEEPIWRLEAARGWFDEVLALDDAGGRLALVANDGERRVELEIRDLAQGGAVVGRAALGEALPVSLAFTRAGPLLVTRAGDRAEAKLYDARGKLLRRAGPATEIAVVERGGRELLVLYTHRGGAHEVVVQELARGRVVARRSLDEGALDLTAPSWRDGWTRVGGRRAGRFDATRDQRMPDTDAVYDLIEGRFVRDAAPGDLVTAARVARERARRPGAGAFLFVDGDRLFAVTGDDLLLTVELPLAIYDAASLRQHARGDVVTFSLRVDPLNPEAIARKKRDPESFDVFRWSPDAPAPARLLRLAGDGRDVVWHAAGGRIAVLRKHRAYGRGGTEVAVHGFVTPDR
jgi:hypothetical protein